MKGRDLTRTRKAAIGRISACCDSFGAAAGDSFMIIVQDSAFGNRAAF